MKQPTLVTLKGIHEMADKSGLTLTDIARESGLSHPTVSNAANGKPISAASAEKISNVIEQYISTGEAPIELNRAEERQRYPRLPRRKHKLAKFEKLEEARAQAGITINELAARSRVGARSIARLQSGAPVRMVSAYKLARALQRLLAEQGIAASDLFDSIEVVERDE